MPAITAGLYTVKLFQSYAGADPLNVFWYRHTLSDNNAAATVRTAFMSDVLPLIAAIQGTTLTYLNLLVQPIFGTGLEASGVPTPSGGTVVHTTDAIAAFIAASFRLFRATAETRSGWKRFAGLQEADLAGGDFSVAYQVLLTNLEAVLDDDLGIANEIQPVLVRKPGIYSGGEQLGWIYTNIQSAAFANRPTTQNTRKTF